MPLLLQFGFFETKKFHLFNFVTSFCTLTNKRMCQFFAPPGKERMKIKGWSRFKKVSTSLPTKLFPSLPNTPLLICIHENHTPKHITTNFSIYTFLCNEAKPQTKLMASVYSKSMKPSIMLSTRFLPLTLAWLKTFLFPPLPFFTLDRSWGIATRKVCLFCLGRNSWRLPIHRIMPLHLIHSFILQLLLTPWLFLGNRLLSHASCSYLEHNSIHYQTKK